MQKVCTRMRFVCGGTRNRRNNDAQVVFVSLLLFATIGSHLLSDFVVAADNTCGDVTITGNGVASSSSTANGPIDFSSAKAFDAGKGKSAGVQGFEADRNHFDYTTVFYAQEDALPVNIEYDFREPTVVCGYAILSVPWTQRAKTDSPTVWTFDGSNDGTNWRVLHRVEDQKPWGPLERRRFDLDRPTKMRHYRLRVTQVRGREDQNGNLKRFVGVAEVEVYGLTSESMVTSMERAESRDDGLMNSETVRDDASSTSSSSPPTSQGWPAGRGWGSGDSDELPLESKPQQQQGWPAETLGAVERDAKIAEEDVLDAVKYDDGRAAEAILLMGLATFVVGFVVIRFKQGQSVHRMNNAGRFSGGVARVRHTVSNGRAGAVNEFAPAVRALRHGHIA
eukprot:g5179.t1